MQVYDSLYIFRLSIYHQCLGCFMCHRGLNNYFFIIIAALPMMPYLAAVKALMPYPATVSSTTDNALIALDYSY